MIALGPGAGRRSPAAGRRCPRRSPPRPRPSRDARAGSRAQSPGSAMSALFHEQHRDVAGFDLAQHGVDRGDAAVGVGPARVDHVQQQVGVDHLFERRTERVDELVREPAHETRPCRRAARSHRRAAAAARGRVERGEQLVLDEHARVGEPVEQRRLARVGVADQRDRRGGLAAGAPCVASRASRRGRAGRARALDAAQQAPPVDLELRLTRTAGADATTLLAELRPAAAQPRQPVAQLRELDLHRARPGSSRAGRRCRGSTRPDRRRRP